MEEEVNNRIKYIKYDNSIPGTNKKKIDGIFYCIINTIGKDIRWVMIVIFSYRLR